MAPLVTRLIWTFVIGTWVACSAEPAPRDAQPRDAGLTGDAGLSGDAGQDAGTTDGDVVDAGPRDGGALVAVLDQRCDYAERAGLLVVLTYGGARRDLGLSLFDSPDPWLGAPALTDAACVFHRVMASCSACAPDRVCDTNGQCVPYPAAIDGITVRLEGTSGTQTLTGDSGSVGGEVTIADDAFGISVQAAGLTIAVPPMSLPAELTNVAGTIGGTYNAPTAVDVTWDPPTGHGQIFTHVPINHHVGGPTFTECVVPNAPGLLHIDGPMLVPLSVATGLEFQGIEHVRFAAVDTPKGCFEIRFSRHYFVNLF